MSQITPEGPSIRTWDAITALLSEGLYRLVYTAVNEAQAGRPIDSEQAIEAQAELHAYIMALSNRIALGDLKENAPMQAIKVVVEEITPPDQRQIIGDIIVRNAKSFQEAIDIVSERFPSSLGKRYEFHPEEYDG